MNSPEMHEHFSKVLSKAGESSVVSMALAHEAVWRKTDAALANLINGLAVILFLIAPALLIFLYGWVL